MKAHSAIIYTNSDSIFLEFPAPEGCERIQTLELPQSPQSLQKIIDILNFRAMGSQKISTKGAPTKWNLRQEGEQALADSLLRGKPVKRRPKDTFKPELRASAREILKKMGLI